MQNLLDNINLPGELSALSEKELKRLAEEIRLFLVKSISETGGHLASNLGVVELTIALYRAFDFPKDKIIWDVGHQAYVHKILSGRKDGFSHLRQFHGMSGFPKTCESEYDCFNTGHSSTSVSAALGMARARDLDGRNENIIAVFGDGALTGGMIYEALNDVGHIKTKLILILNDNAMSISKNVGAISKHLRNLRTKPGYFKSKKRVEKVLSKIPLCGNVLAGAIRRIKRLVRNTILPPTIFDDLGIKYIGPIDGHNISAITKALEAAKESQRPILIHVLTKKGKGFVPAEQNPQYFHGVSGFDLKAKNFEFAEDETYSTFFGKKLCELAQKNPKITAVTAAMPDGTGLNIFEKKYKNRFFDVGIAEQHAITFSAGMAMAGYIPVAAIYSSFCQRAYDQILHDVCLQNLHVVLCVDRAGIVGADGETHHGLYDIAYLSHMPNMAILSPSSFDEFAQMLEYAVENHKGPVAIRYPRGNKQFNNSKPFRFGQAELIENGTDVMIISSGRMMNTADSVRKILEKKGVLAGLCELPTILPLDEKQISSIVKNVRLTAVIEDHGMRGGIGSIIACALEKENAETEFVSFAYPSEPVTHGKVEELDELYGLTAESIAEKIGEKLNGKNKT